MATNRRRQVRACALALGTTLLAGALQGSSAAKPTWLAPRNLSAAGENVGDVSVALDRVGNALAVWSSSFGATSTSRVRWSQRRVGADWSAPQDLQAAGLEDRSAQVVLNPAGDAVAVWEQLTESAGWTIQASTRPAGGGWTAPQALSAGADDLGSLRVAVDRRGNAVAVWERRRFLGPKDDAGTVQAAVHSAHGGWGAATKLSPVDSNAGGADVALDAAGNAVAVWSQDVEGTVRGVIRSARRPSGGAWSAPQRISSPTEDACVPSIAVDAAGDAIAVWSGYDQVVRAARRAAGGRWGAPRALSPGGTATSPAVASDAAGDTVVVWEQDYRGIVSATRPHGGVWTRPATVPSLGTAAVPDVALDAAGDAVAVWLSFNSAHQQIVRASRRSAGRGWGRARTLSAPGADALSANVVLDARGDGIASWERGYGPQSIVQAAGLDASGPVVARVSIPRQARVKERLRFSLSTSDDWSSLAGPPRWSFGDGGAARGTTVTHTYGRAGSYRVRVTQSDAVGNQSTVRRSIRIGRSRS